MGGDSSQLSLTEIADAARALSGGLRSQYLDEHCLDAAMRAEVESLLAEPQTTATLSAANVENLPPLRHEEQNCSK